MCWVGGASIQGRYDDTFLGIQGGHWGGYTACVGGVCMRGDWFPPVKSVADKFLVFTHCLWSFWLVGIGFSVHLRFSV